MTQTITQALTNKKNLIPYFTFGDPDIATTEALIKASFEAGAGLIEIGIPFSDPIADGPTIQASHYRALQSGQDVSITNALKMVQRIKKSHSQPIIFMLAFNLVYHYGITQFFKDAKRFGLDGVIIPDLPFEEAGLCETTAKKNKIALILLLSPLNTSKRIRKIVTSSTGFIYLIAAQGTTGERQSVAKNLAQIAAQIKAIKPIPVAVGFGISTRDHVQTVFNFADAAIIGSHFVKIIEKNLKNPQKAIAEISTEIRKLLSKN